MNRAVGGRILGVLPGGGVEHDCVERRQQFEARVTGVTILPPARPEERWRAVVPLGVLPDDGTMLGAGSLCNLMDKLELFYPDLAG